MNRYSLIRRLRGPAFLLLIGIMALLSQADILGWGQSWPLLLILAGLLSLAERAALASCNSYPPPPQTPWPGTPASGTPYPGGPYAPPAATAPVSPADPGSSLVPASSQAIVKDPEGGQS
jgi:hypothetical protein